MSIVHDGGGILTRYDLSGEVVARARRTPAGWVITSPGGGTSEPVPGDDEAHRRLAAWDAAAAALDDVQRAAGAYQQARRHLEDAIRQAYAAEVPQTRIASVSGFSRQWIRHLLRQ